MFENSAGTKVNFRVKILVCIPARYSSVRFPGKVLAKDTGKFLIQHTWEQACRASLPKRVIIAADDQRIADAAKTFGAECILTSPEHKSGTDRIAEVVGKLAYSGQRSADSKDKKLYAKRYMLNADDIIINLQADEPEFEPADIDYLAKLLLDNPNCPMATLAAEFQNVEQIVDPNIVKVIVSSIEMSDVSAAKISIRKNAAPMIDPPGICANAVDRVTNRSPAPSVGSRP